MRKWIAIGLVAFVVVVCYKLVSAVNKVREAANSATCDGRVCCIALCMHSYHEKYGHLPPAYLVDKDGKPAHSWRVILLEFIEPEVFKYYNFDEPWNSPNNIRLESKMPRCYACPSAPKDQPKFETNYFVIVGDQTAFPFSKSVKFEDIQKTLGKTVLFVESIKQGIHWMEPKDLLFSEMSFEHNDLEKPSHSDNHYLRQWPTVAMADGASGWLKGVGPEQFKQMILIKKPVAE